MNAMSILDFATSSKRVRPASTAETECKPEVAEAAIAGLNTARSYSIFSSCFLDFRSIVVASN
jgi:hypothetical protein